MNLVAVCLATALVTGCASTLTSNPPPAAPPTVHASLLRGTEVPSQPLDGAARTSIDEVADRVCGVWFGWNTVTDSGPFDASLRAIPLLDPATVTDLLTHPPANGPGADWLRLASSRVTASVSVVPAFESGGPADSSERAYRLRVITQAFVGDAAPFERHTVVGVVLRRSFDGWRVVSVSPR